MYPPNITDRIEETKHGGLYFVPSIEHNIECSGTEESLLFNLHHRSDWLNNQMLQLLDVNYKHIGNIM